MKALAEGRLDGDAVVVDDVAQANRLHNKSHAGVPEAGNSLRLHRIEAAYCMDKAWLRIPDASVTDLLLAGAAEGGQNEVDHVCYGDLRERGLTVRIQDGNMIAWPRGETPKQEPWFTTRAFPERLHIRAADLTDLPGTVSIVDEDGALTHYSVAAVAPSGDVPAPDLAPMQGVLLDDRVLVSDANAATQLHGVNMGTAQGTGRVLSLVEAAYLAAQGTLSVEGDIHAQAMARQANHEEVETTYDALRAAGVLPKSGFRFGTHLRAYAAQMGDVHAQWLIHCVAPHQELVWSDLSRAVRLAHGVRKSFLVAIAPKGGPVQFLELAWFRP